MSNGLAEVYFDSGYRVAYIFKLLLCQFQLTTWERNFYPRSEPAVPKPHFLYCLILTVAYQEQRRELCLGKKATALPLN